MNWCIAADRTPSACVAAGQSWQSRGSLCLALFSVIRCHGDRSWCQVPGRCDPIDEDFSLPAVIRPEQGYPDPNTGRQATQRDLESIPLPQGDRVTLAW